MRCHTVMLLHSGKIFSWNITPMLLPHSIVLTSMTRQHSVLNNIRYTPNFSGNDRLCLLYTGLSLDAFQSLTDELTTGCSISQLHPKDKLLMTLMKLRLNLLQDDIAERFRVSQSVVSRVISQWLDLMEEKMRCCVPWLPREDNPGNDATVLQRALSIHNMHHRLF